MCRARNCAVPKGLHDLNVTGQLELKVIPKAAPLPSQAGFRLTDHCPRQIFIACVSRAPGRAQAEGVRLSLKHK